ncbi:hypothetical protein TcCL_Unassigned02150 [Trypanosoma cruzi]|nr:hypothetical protein TcCL_Unassigned02150 [Trypanosoma cruzi]
MHLTATKRPSTSVSRQTPNAKGLVKKNKHTDGLPQYIPTKNSLSTLKINTVNSQKPPHRAKNRAMPLLAMLCCLQIPPSVVFRQKKTFTNQQQEKPPHATCAPPWSIACLPASKRGAVTSSARLATNTPNCKVRNTLRRDHRFPDKAAHSRPPCLPSRTHQASRCNAREIQKYATDPVAVVGSAAVLRFGMGG